MNPAYVKKVEAYEFFVSPGEVPAITMNPTPRLVSTDEIHVKQFSQSTIYREMETFLQEIHDEYGDCQVIETLGLDKFLLLVYAVPRLAEGFCQVRVY